MGHRCETSPQGTNTTPAAAQRFVPRSVTVTQCPHGPRTLSLYLLGGPAAGEEVAIIVTMQRDVENVGVSVEDLLSPVAVVNVLEGEELGKRCFTVFWVI